MLSHEGIKRIVHHVLNHKYDIEGKRRTFQYLGDRKLGVEVWYENEDVKRFINQMPYREFVIQVFGGYLKLYSKPIKYILVIDDIHKNDNWYYREDKVWVITTLGVTETILDTLRRQNKNIDPLESYIEAIKKGREQ